MSAAHRASRTSRPSRRALLPGAALAAGLVLLVVAVFLPVRDHEFVDFDDHIYIRDNPMLVESLSPESLARAFRPYEANWIPLTWISFQVDQALYGASPPGVHLVNLGLHALATVLLFLALARMTGAPWPSAFVAAVFAVHPLHVESVAWAAERKDVLCGLFWMLALWAHARYAERPGAARYALVALSCALSLLAKPAAVTLPFALLLLDAWPLGRLRRDAWRLPVLEKLPLLALSGAASAITVASQEASGALSYGARIAFDARLANAVQSYVAYLVQTFWPTGLAVLYPLPPDWSAARVGASLLLLLGLSAAVLELGRRRPYLAVGWLWFLGTLVPMIGLVQVGWQARADRYTYLPLVGPAIAVAWLGADLAARRRALRVAVAVAAVLAVGALAAAARVQVGTWSDTETLFRRALAVTEGNVVAHYRLGVELHHQERLAEAEAQYAAAVALRPPWIDPYLTQANLLASQGRLDEARRHYRAALELDGDHVDTLMSLGVAELRAGRIDAAYRALERARAQGAESAVLYASLAHIADARGRTGVAIEHNRRALALDPSLLDARNNLAWLLATAPEARLRDPAEAIALAEGAVRDADGGHPGLLDTLAAAYAAAGRFDEAVEAAERAAELASGAGEAGLAAQIRTRAALYRAGRPYRPARAAP